MTCDQYLATLATASVGELDLQREHAARCPDCARVTRLVVERERHRAAAFDALASYTPAYVTSDVALETARERRVDRLYAAAFAVVLAVTAAVALRVTSPGLLGRHEIVRTPPTFEAEPAAPMLDETLLVRCVPPRVAAELIQPRLTMRSNRIIISSRDGVPGTLTVRATARQLRTVRATLDEFEAATCASRPTPVTPPPVP